MSSPPGMGASGDRASLAVNRVARIRVRGPNNLLRARSIPSSAANLRMGGPWHQLRGSVDRGGRGMPFEIEVVSDVYAFAQETAPDLVETFKGHPVDEVRFLANVTGPE